METKVTTHEKRNNRNLINEWIKPVDESEILMIKEPSNTVTIYCNDDVCILMKYMYMWKLAYFSE